MFPTKEFRPHERFWIDLGPYMEMPWLPKIQFGGDEYGNPSIFFRTKWIGITFFYGRLFQRDIELPELGTCAWVDRTFYSDTMEDYEEINRRNDFPICPKHNKRGFRGHFTSAIGCEDCVDEMSKKLRVIEMAKRFINKAMENIEKEIMHGDG